jgi:hypothetical protein
MVVDLDQLLGAGNGDRAGASRRIPDERDLQDPIAVAAEADLGIADDEVVVVDVECDRIRHRTGHEGDGDQLPRARIEDPVEAHDLPGVVDPPREREGDPRLVRLLRPPVAGIGRKVGCPAARLAAIVDVEEVAFLEA